jgi:5-methylcytosine-specific restriction endonuclease McrA
MARLKNLKLVSKKPSVDELDDLFREFIRRRDKVCQVCGKATDLQVSHIFSRSNRAIRWDEDNAMLLCKRHHLYWAHKNPVEFAEFVRNKLGEWKYEALKMRKSAVRKTDLSAVKLYLEKKIKEL